MKKYFIYINFALLTLVVNAQTFVNGDLNGTIGNINIVTLTGWTNVLNTDPVSNAGTWSGFATADILSILGPNITTGLLANPQSGSTCVSALSSETSSGSIFHEGIKQTVTGFTIGTDYTLQFYQTVVKQANTLDPTGSWEVYLNNTLLNTTAISTSLLPFNSTSLIWDQRNITFTATATSLTFKFLPKDDDANHVASTTDITGGLRMGIDNISLFVTPPLPIELLSFKVECEDGYNIINWQTATEINNDYFTIERSTNAVNWEEVATITGSGNSNSIKTYHYKDDNKNTQETYYRLKQTDFNGGYEYFNITSAKKCNNQLNNINIYPNPVTNNSLLEITTQNNTLAQVQIIDVLGNIVQAKNNLTLQKGVNEVAINIEYLSKGVYIYIIELEGKYHQLKFTK